MTKMLLFSIALFLLSVSTAVGQDVRYNFDKDTDFAKFKTYKWVALKDAPEVDNLRDKQIKEAVDANLLPRVLPKPTLILPIFTLATRRQSAQRNSSPLITRIGDMVRVGTAAVGTEVEAA